ncbi:UvrD-helicase domain-containing protein [Cupriavidus basilensis]
MKRCSSSGENRLRYFLVDEYQDTNACQYQLLKLLAGGSHLRAPAFTAVGDDDQAIYGWRGATAWTTCVCCRPISLTSRSSSSSRDYRSTVRILEAANAVIANNPKLFEKKLWSEHGMGDPIAIHPMNDEEHEAESVVFRLSAHRSSSAARSSAITRSCNRGNHQAAAVRANRSCGRERIPYVLSGGQSFFDKAESQGHLRLPAADRQPRRLIPRSSAPSPRRAAASATPRSKYWARLRSQAKVSLFEAAMMGGIEAKLQPRQLEPLRVFLRIDGPPCRPRGEGPGQRSARRPDGRHPLRGLPVATPSTNARRSRAGPTRSSFSDWLKRKGTRRSGRRGRSNRLPTRPTALATKAKNLLELTQTVALMSMLEGREEDPDAVRLSTLHARPRNSVSARVPGRRGRGHSAALPRG